MKYILLAYGLPKETDTAIIMLYSNTKVKVHTPEKVRFFNIIAGVLQGDALSPYLFIICQNYILRKSIDLIKENCFSLKKKKARSRRYPSETITDANYANGIALLINTPTQVEFLLHSLEQVAGGIGLHVNVDKTEYMCFNQEGAISTLIGSSLKLADRFSFFR